MAGVSHHDAAQDLGTSIIGRAELIGKLFEPATSVDKQCFMHGLRERCFGAFEDT